MKLQWLSSPEWANIVKALLHTLWQGAVVAVLLGSALRQLHNPVVRYRSSLATLAAVLLGGLITWALLNQPVTATISQAPVPVTPAPASVIENFSPVVLVNVAMTKPKPVAIGWTAWLALVWLAGAVVMLGRAGIQVAGAEQLRRASHPLDDAHIAELLAEARRAVGLARRVRIAVTVRLTSPAVVGVLVPTLILPLSLTASLTPEQIRFILLHELAHIRRGDYFANLFQLFAEALLFFNPAIWWISRQMRLEREACCDALAIELSGAPADYARTLVHVAENILQPAPAAATAFGDKGEPSSLADRVQRMLVPGYRPKLRLTWRAMLAALFVGGALLTLSAIGTRVTVAAILSPEQRIERIEKKMTELGEKPVAANYSDDEHAPKVKISGSVRAADGSRVPQWVNLSFNSTAGRSSFGTGSNAKDGKFSTSVRAGIIQIGAETIDFAPFALAPLDGLATNSFENIEIILERGFEAALQVVDADSQKPLPDVRVATIYWIGHSGFQSRSTNTDASGVIALPHSADLPIDATINTPGYEITKKHFDHVRTNEPLRVSLRRGATLTGTVFDQATGKPLAGAEFHLLYQATGEDAGRFEWNDAMRTLGQSGADGAFVLNQLRGGMKYYLGVSAPGHESVILNNIFTGTSNLVVSLGSEIIVRGHVNGSLDELQIINHDRTLEATTTEKFENNSQGHSEWVVLHETNGMVTFQFTNRVAGLVTLTGRNGYREEREVTAPIDDWIVNIAEKRSREVKFLPKREVVFRFTHSSGVAPRGTVEVLVPDNLDPQHGTAHYEELQITNSEVRVPIAIGGRTSIEAKRMVGFWFNRTGNWKSPTGESGSLFSIEVRSNATPLVIEVPLIPAGTIYARAKNADGTPSGELFFCVTELKRAPGRDQNSLDNGSDNFDGNSPRQWISGPLPLGGKYQIHAWRGNSFCISEPVKLTESEPDAEVELQFAPGKTFHGQLLDADGKPLRGVELKTTFNLQDNHGFGLKSIFTDEHGRFELTDTTPDMGEYSIETAVPGLLAEKVVLNFSAQPQIIRLKRGRTLAGRVVDSVSGQPIPEMEVRALDYESNKLPMQTTHTDADGHFEFTSLGDANYTLYPDGGELLGRPTYGNLKFRADGRTNLVLTVKLYEWSKLKPKAAPAHDYTNAVKSILEDPNFRVVLKALERRSTNETLGEPDATTIRSRRSMIGAVNHVETAVAQIQQQNYSNNAALGSEQPNRATNTPACTGPGRENILENLVHTSDDIRFAQQKTPQQPTPSKQPK